VGVQYVYVCQNQRTRGPWSQTERQMYINCLQLLAATFAFLKNKSRLLESGQHYNCGIHQQSGRHSFRGLGRLGQESMDVVPGTEHSHHSATPARCAKRDCGVTDNEVSVRLATEPCPVQQDCQSLHGVQ
jgi:hypothetical protein